MDLYHGSDHIIKKPSYGIGNPHNDYGPGFYCTEIPDMAREWSVREGMDGFINHYTLKKNNLSILDLHSDEYDILHWLTILIENRSFDAPSVLAQDAMTYLKKHYSTDYRSYDIIMGYRADDSYFSFARDFLNGTISYRQLGNAMRLGELGIQIVLISEKAFNGIKFLDSEPVDSSFWFPKREARDQTARSDYHNLEKNRRKRGDIYITSILDEEILPGDKRLKAR